MRAVSGAWTMARSMVSRLSREYGRGFPGEIARRHTVGIRFVLVRLLLNRRREFRVVRIDLR